MSVQSVELSGGGVLGIHAPGLRAVLEQLPVSVKLGRKPPTMGLHAPRFSAHFDQTAMTQAPPASTNRRTTAAAALARMYLNDTLGCCVIASKAHALGLWAGAESALDVEAADAEIRQQYTGICGPGDNGCVITDVLNVMKSTGFLAGGKHYPIDGYVAVDWTNQLEVQVVTVVYGASCIGINLPQAWTTAAVWDVPTGAGAQIVGGHDVCPVDYAPEGVYVSSWGRIYLMTWAAFQSRTWVEEMYAMLAPLWYAQGNMSPYGINAATLKADMVALQGGTIPDPGPGPGPKPPLPPPPPSPPPVPGPSVLFPFYLSRNVPQGGRILLTARKPMPAGYYAVATSTAAGMSGASMAISGEEILALIVKYGPVVLELLTKYGPGALALIESILKGGGTAALDAVPV